MAYNLILERDIVDSFQTLPEIGDQLKRFFYFQAKEDNEPIDVIFHIRPVEEDNGR